jgi:MFS superfamily sulfate permease-like transporter
VRKVKAAGRFQIAAVVFLAAPGDAFAYIGPGVGSGAVAVVLGILAALFLALVGIIWYPMKRRLKRLGYFGAQTMAEPAPNKFTDASVSEETDKSSIQ